MKLDFVSLRPNSFEEYVGQPRLKEKLSMLIESAKMRDEALDHILLYGPPGLGKTTAAWVISNSFGSPLKIVSGPSIERTGDVVALLMSLRDKELLFIDEIHALNRPMEEILYSAMEDGNIDFVIGKGPTAKSVRVKLNKFTLIGATTKSSLLTSPLRDRFGLLHKIEYYSQKELEKIIIRSAEILGVGMADNAAAKIAVISRGTPRVANRFLKRARDFASVNKIGKIDLNCVEKVLQIMEIDELGLDVMDREILKVIADRYSGGPVGIAAIAATLGEDRKTVENVHEPYLVKIGLLDRSKKGRTITPAGFKHIKRSGDEDI